MRPLRRVITVFAVLSFLATAILMNPILFDSVSSHSWSIWSRIDPEPNAFWDTIGFIKFYNHAYTVREAILSLDLSEKALSTVPDTLDSKMIPRRYPLRIWVDGDAVLWEEARVAAHAWEYAVGVNDGEIFRFTTKEEEAEIVIFVGEFYLTRGTYCLIPDYVFLGKFCSPRFTGSPMVIGIGEPLRNDRLEIGLTILHELGHAGFALGHSSDPLSIMHSDGMGSVTADDTAAVKAFLRSFTP